MRIQFSLRMTFIAMAVVGFLTVLSLWTYHHYVVPNAPLDWQPFQAKRLETNMECEHPIVIAPCLIWSHKEPDLRYLLENPKFRMFVYQHDIELLAFDYSISYPVGGEPLGHEEECALDEFLRQQYPDIPDIEFCIPDFLLALPGHKRLLMFTHQFPDSEDIIAAIETNGRVLKVEEP